MSEAATIEEPEILRADGLKPSKHGYIPHSEIWFLNRGGEYCRRFSCRWHFCYVALSDGRFVLSGCVYDIKKDHDSTLEGRNNFPTRTTAIRAAAARLIRVMRGSRNWGGHWDQLMSRDLAIAVNWVLDTVNRETGEARSKRRLVVGPRGLVEQLAAAGWSRKQIRKYVATLPAHGPR